MFFNILLLTFCIYTQKYQYSHWTWRKCDISFYYRDLKSDNILLSLSEGWDYPLLVLTDFGCSIASNSANISVRFPSLDADPRQGNPALMAPEVSDRIHQQGKILVKLYIMAMFITG